MQIADMDGKPRASYVQSDFGALDSGTLKALADRFTVRVFRFSSTATRAAQGRDSGSRGPRPGSGRRSRPRARNWPGCRWPGW
jgi:hypothetical protein